MLRFIDQVAGDLTPGLQFRYSEGVLTDFDVDVVHVLDSKIEALLGTRAAAPWQRILATALFARNLRIHGIALVRTLDTHPDSGRMTTAARIAGRLLDRATTIFVRMDESTPAPDPARSVVIPHADYRDRFVGYPSGAQEDGLVLCIAGHPLGTAEVELLGAIRVTRTPDLRMRLVGEAPPAVQGLIWSGVARARGRCSARLERLSDGARVVEIDRAELIVIPRPTVAVDDLQLVYLALSRARPVLTVRTPRMALLADEVGHEWIHLVDGAVTVESIEVALRVKRERRRAHAPRLDRRRLHLVQGAYAEAFRVASDRVVGLPERERSSR